MTPVRATPRPDRRLRLVAPHRDVADGHARDVADRVPRPGLEQTDSQTEFAQAGRAHGQRLRTASRLWSADDTRDARRLVGRLPPARAGRRDLDRATHAGDGAACARRRDPLGARPSRTRGSSTARRTRRRAAARGPRRALRRVPGERLGASGSAAGLPAEHGADRVVPYVFAHGALAHGLPLAATGRRVGAGGLLRLRHDDPDRPGNLGGRPRGGRHGAHRRRSRRRRARRTPTRAAGRPATTRATRRSAARVT